MVLFTGLQLSTGLRESHFYPSDEELSLSSSRSEVFDECEEGFSLLGELGEGQVAGLQLLETLVEAGLQGLDFGGARALGGLHYGGKIQDLRLITAFQWLSS